MHALTWEVFGQLYAKSIEMTKQNDQLFLNLAILLYNQTEFCVNSQSALSAIMQLIERPALTLEVKLQLAKLCVSCNIENMVILMSSNSPRVQNFIFNLVNAQILSLDYAKCINEIQRLECLGLTQVCLQLYQNENMLDHDVYMTRGR